MFCYQCEQTAKGEGCTVRGVCGKKPETASLQDLLIYLSKGVAQYAYRAGKLGKNDSFGNKFITQALFSTLTNVNFDSERLQQLIIRGLEVKELSRILYESACSDNSVPVEKVTGPALWAPDSTSIDALVKAGEEMSVLHNIEMMGQTSAGLLELIIYGLKGVAAYLDHASILGYDDDALYAEVSELLDFTTHKDLSVEDLLSHALKVGELNYKVMQLLDQAHTKTFGHPEPTTVRVSHVKGKAILISGHDLKDLELLLRQTEGKGINIYTHGEMLPAHGYPGLKKYPHLAGNYGGAWQDQQKEFAAFPGAILMTTNCIQEPRESYADRIFTTGLVAWPGTHHLVKKDFTPVIEAALSMEGFEDDDVETSITVGFGHNAVVSVADKVLYAIRTGELRHIFLIGGCDGAKPGRNYYTDFAQAVPDDCMILTLACGKYRFNKHDFGTVAGLPRLLDIGQCNDAYSALRIAMALAEASKCGVNDLPLSMVLSWFEQKAVAILLTLLHLGVKNIRLGPTMPAFLTDDVLSLLESEFELKLVDEPAKDLEEILELCDLT